MTARSIPFSGRDFNSLGIISTGDCDNDNDIGAAIAESFLRILYPTVPPGACVSLWIRRTKISLHLPANDLAAVAAAAADISAAGKDVYFGLGLRRPGLPEHKRGSLDDVVVLPAFWADVDLAGGAHAAANLPASVDVAFDLLDEAYGPHQPSLIVKSGYGLHCYWLFRHPWALTSHNRPEAAAYSRAHQRRLIAVAATRNLHIDDTADLARVLRLPGTANYKVVK